jgi:hypothetical protein
MDSITTTAIAAFLAACLTKAGEKFSEKSVETVFENKQTLADKFTKLFKDDIIELGLNEATTTQVVQQQLEAKPRIADQAIIKLTDNKELVDELKREWHEHLQTISNPMINNAKNVGAMGVVQIEQQTNNFS